MTESDLGLLGDLLVNLGLSDSRKGVSTCRIDFGAHLHGFVCCLIHESWYFLAHAGLLKLLVKTLSNSAYELPSLLNHWSASVQNVSYYWILKEASPTRWLRCCLLLLLRCFSFNLFSDPIHVVLKGRIILSDLACRSLNLLNNCFTTLVIRGLLRFFERYTLYHASQLQKSSIWKINKPLTYSRH